MKIRTKIIWISCIAVFAASLIGDAVIFLLAKKSYMNEALIQSFQSSYNNVSKLEQSFEQGLNLNDNRYLEYYFKVLGDDYNICLQTIDEYDGGEKYKEIYNHTIFDADILIDINYKIYEEIGSSGYEYAYFDYNGGQYIIFTKNLMVNYNYYRIEDISYVWKKMEWLLLSLVVITLVLTAMTSFILFIILRRVFKPLWELNETAKQMAKGLYSHRLNIEHKDEIGQLGESFNKMAEAVLARTRSLEESEMKKTLFMGNLTHELKTPMTAISGYAQTLLSTKLSKQQQEEALIYIYEECGRLERLSRKMIKLLELDREVKLELTATPIKSVFEAVNRACAAILKEKDIVLEISADEEIFNIDADLMTDALINLTDNAIKASDRGGRIILKAYENVIEVQDFGKGIPESEQEKILEPFYMIDKSRSRKNGGAGLGLALTAIIAKRHNMILKIESKVGEGTRMILQFV